MQEELYLNFFGSADRLSLPSPSLRSMFNYDKVEIKISQVLTFKNFCRNKHNESWADILRHSVWIYYMEAEEYAYKNHDFWCQ